MLFSAPCSRRGSNPGWASKLTTCPQAWTPASVRPAHERLSTGWRSTCPSAFCRAPSTVRAPGWAAKPRNALPSYATTSLQRAGPSFFSNRVTRRLDELHSRHGRVVAPARAELENPQVASVAVGVAGGDLAEQL